MLNKSVITTTLCLFFLFCNISFAQFTVNAGADAIICPGTSTPLGGAPSATGGLAPYTYLWAPATGLTSNTIANPIASPLNSITYTLTVSDDTGAVKRDFVTIQLKSISFLNAGSDISLCITETGTIGGIYNYSNPSITYAWSPGLTLSDSTSPQPIASPTVTTTYTLIVTEAGCAPKKDEVIVTVIPPPPINAGNDTTIFEGTTITLHGSGASNWDWSPKSTLFYFYTSSPNAQPLTTTLYYVGGTDPTGRCPNFDTVIVTVIPSAEVVIYNTFTPNGDAQNDTWYIANIYKYPNNSVKVYNRYGKLVFQTSGYNSDWDGKSNGENLPEGTYFYDLNLGDEKGIRHGTVSIVR